MKTVLHPTYFPDILLMATMVQTDCVWEVHDNYQKQTYRNRCNIATDRGIHSMIVPIIHAGGKQGRQKVKDVQIENVALWQRQHWRTLQTAYRTSPFFEYYEDDIAPIYQEKHPYLLDFNFRSIEILCNCLQIKFPTIKTTNYTLHPTTEIDARFLVNCKTEHRFEQQQYTQVFGDRHGFIKNTSVLDLLFNEGPNALSYLKQQNLEFLDA